MRPFRRPEVYAAVCLAAACAAQAQSPTDGALHGQAPPFAMIRLQSEDTGLIRRVEGSRSGDFLISNLPPGAYQVRFELPSQPAVAQQVEITLGATTELQSVTVTADAPDPTPALSAAITLPELAQLPSDGRRWQDFALLTPGIGPDQDDDGLISARGLPSTQNSLLVDGLSANQSFNSVPAGSGSRQDNTGEDDSDAQERTTGPAFGLGRGRHAGVAYTFSQAAVREFRVTEQNGSALTGNAAGAVVTTVSRSGTGVLHGSGLFILRSQLFAATDPYSVAVTYANGLAADSLVKPHDLRENFAGTLGGPVPDARGLFFFYAYDGQRRGFPAISSPADPQFYTLTAIQTALLKNRGVSTTATAAGLTYLDSLTGSTSRRQDENLNFARVDWDFHPASQLGVQYNRVRWSSPAGLLDAPVVARGRASLGTAAGSLDAIQTHLTTGFGRRLVNDLRVQGLRDLQYETPQTPLANEPAIGPGGTAPEVNIGPDGLLFGTPATLSQQAYPDERRLEFNDTLSLALGHHVLELGGSASFVDDRVGTLANAAGTFDYDSTRTTANAGGLVDFLTDQTFNVHVYPNGGCPSITAADHLFCFTSFTQSFGPQRVAFATEEWAGFAQDTWRPAGRVGHRVTLTAGVRYEYELLPLPQQPNPALDSSFSTQAATGIFPEDRNNLGPRAGFSVEPFGTGRGTIRAGFGLYFGRLPGALISRALANTDLPTSTTRIRILPSTVTACPQVTAQGTGQGGQGFGYPCDFTAQPTGVVDSTASAMVFSRRFRLPAVEQGSLALERSVRHVDLTAAYLFNLDRQLQSSTDLNIAPSTTLGHYQIQGGAGQRGVMPDESFVVPLYTARVNPAFGPVTELESNADASYNALALTASAHPGRGLLVRANYTWSKALDDGPNQGATPRTDGQFDPFTNGYDKGLSSLNYPQSFHAAAVWTPQLRTRAAALRAVLNGWELAPIVVARSGRPYSYDLYGGTRLNGGHLSLNGSGGAVYLPTVGRNTLRLPATVNADLRLARSFHPGAHVRREPLVIRASAEAFNVSNRRNLSSVETRAFLVGAPVAGITPLVFQDAATIATEGINTLPFGTPNAASTSLARERQVQLSLRIEF